MARSRAALWAHVLLIGVTVVWGASFPLVKATLRECSPLVFNALRMVLAAVVLVCANWRHLTSVTRGQLLWCALAGVLLAAGYELQTTGLVYTTPSRSAFITGLVVVWVPFLSLLPGLRLRGAPRPHLLAFAGALLGFSGIVLLTSPSGTGAGLLTGMHRGEWLTMLCAVAYALHLLTLAHAAQQVGARVLGCLQIVFAALAMLALLPLDPHPRFRASALVLVALLVTAVLATAVAFTIQSWAQQHLPASHTALILTLEPVFAVLASWVFLHEGLSGRALAGAICVLTGIVLAELGPTVLTRAAILPLEP